MAAGARGSGPAQSKAGILGESCEPAQRSAPGQVRTQRYPGLRPMRLSIPAHHLGQERKEENRLAVRDPAGLWHTIL